MNARGENQTLGKFSYKPCSKHNMAKVCVRERKGEGQGAPPFGMGPVNQNYTNSSKSSRHRPCRRGSSRSNCSYGLSLQGVGPRCGRTAARRRRAASRVRPRGRRKRQRKQNVPPDPRLANHKRPQTAKGPFVPPQRHKVKVSVGVLAPRCGVVTLSPPVSAAEHARSPKLLKTDGTQRPQTYDEYNNALGCEYGIFGCGWIGNGTEPEEAV